MPPTSAWWPGADASQDPDESPCPRLALVLAIPGLIGRHGVHSVQCDTVRHSAASNHPFSTMGIVKSWCVICDDRNKGRYESEDKRAEAGLAP